MNELPNLDAFEVLEAMGLEKIHPASGGQEVKFLCPLHDDTRPSAYMNVDTTAWMCQACKERGRNVVSLVAKVYGVSYATASTWLRESYGVDFREPEGGSMAAETEARFAPSPEVPELVRPSPSWQESFVAALLSDDGAAAYEYIRSRGFDSETINEWGFGYDFLSRRLTIPVYDLDGELAGFKARSIDDSQPKYLVIGDGQGEISYGFHRYEPSEHVFGLHRRRDADTVVLCEGEIDPAALSQIGVERPVGLGMSYFSDRAARLIVQEARQVVCFFDSDEAGTTGMWGGVVAKLEPHMTVCVVEPHDRDPAKLLEDGDGTEALRLIESAQPSLVVSTSW